MAHDGNTQRDGVPRPAELSDDERGSAGTAPKHVLPAEGPPHPSEGKPLPKFNSIPRPVETRASGGRPAVETKAAPSRIPLQRPKAERPQPKPTPSPTRPAKEAHAASEEPAA